MPWRERNIAPYPQRMTGVLGRIEKYHSQDSWLQKLFKKKTEKLWWGGGEMEHGGTGTRGHGPLGPPLNPPMILATRRINWNRKYKINFI